MSPEIPPDNASELSWVKAERRTRELLLWHKLAEKYLYSETDDVVALAGRLKNWQVVESQDPHLEESSLP